MHHVVVLVDLSASVCGGSCYVKVKTCCCVLPFEYDGTKCNKDGVGKMAAKWEAFLG